VIPHSSQQQIFADVIHAVYAYTGTQYNTAPAFGSLGNEVYAKVAFSFMIPTLLFLGVLYASVSARFVFFRVFEGSRHKSSHTLVGWASWAGILALTWILAFIIAEVIPFFADLLALMSSLFDSFFGWIFWGVAYLRMRRADHGPNFYKVRGWRGWVGFLMNIFIILVGIYFLGVGTYVSSGHLYFAPITLMRPRLPLTRSSSTMKQGTSRVLLRVQITAFRGQSRPRRYIWRHLFWSPPKKRL
jgi:hypothetical protein